MDLITAIKSTIKNLALLEAKQLWLCSPISAKPPQSNFRGKESIKPSPNSWLTKVNVLLSRTPWTTTKTWSYSWMTNTLMKRQKNDSSIGFRQKGLSWLNSLTMKQAVNRVAYHISRVAYHYIHRLSKNPTEGTPLRLIISSNSIQQHFWRSAQIRLPLVGHRSPHPKLSFFIGSVDRNWTQMKQWYPLKSHQRTFYQHLNLSCKRTSGGRWRPGQ